MRLGLLLSQRRPGQGSNPCHAPESLREHAEAVAQRLRETLAHGFETDRRSVQIIDLVSAINLIMSAVPNLSDVDRLNRLARAGAAWRVIIGGKVVGSGNIRAAIDQAISTLNLT